ncbi:hypothetical protein GCM10027610_013420 [Dactylosporangium cerinum]
MTSGRQSADGAGAGTFDILTLGDGFVQTSVQRGVLDQPVYQHVAWIGPDYRTSNCGLHR